MELEEIKEKLRYGDKKKIALITSYSYASIQKMFAGERKMPIIVLVIAKRIVEKREKEIKENIKHIK